MPNHRSTRIVHQTSQESVVDADAHDRQTAHHRQTPIETRFLAQFLPEIQRIAFRDGAEPSPSREPVRGSQVEPRPPGSERRSPRRTLGVRRSRVAEEPGNSWPLRRICPPVCGRLETVAAGTRRSPNVRIQTIRTTATRRPVNLSARFLTRSQAQKRAPGEIYVDARESSRNDHTVSLNSRGATDDPR